MQPVRNDTDGYYRLLTAIIDKAVLDFNEGSNITEKRDAARFFQDSPEATWMCGAVGAKPSDVVKARLKSDPWADVLKPNKPQRRCSPAKMIEWDGRSMTIAEWASELELTYYTLNTRLKAYGVCEKSFRRGRLTDTAKKLTWEGETLSIRGWAGKLALDETTIRMRIAKHGISAKTFKCGDGRCAGKTGVVPRFITWDGVKKTRKAWAKHIGISYQTFYWRYSRYGLCAKLFRPSLARKANAI